eukprot:s530_g4.t5
MLWVLVNVINPKSMCHSAPRSMWDAPPPHGHSAMAQAYGGPPPPPTSLPPLGALGLQPPPPPTFGTPVAFPQIQHAPGVHPTGSPHAVMLGAPPPPPAGAAFAAFPPPPPSAAAPSAVRGLGPSLGDAEVKAAASAALNKFMKDLPHDSPSHKRSRSRRSGRSSSTSRSRRRRKRSRSRKRKKSGKEGGNDETLLEPPPAPRSKWDDSTTPAWMQDMVEALKNDSTRPRASTPSPAAPVSKKNDPDQPKGHKVIDLPAHLIRVLIGKAGSTIREVISRTGSDIKVNHLPHEPHGSISVVGDIAKTEAVIQEVFRARGCKWSPTGAPLAEQSQEDVPISADLVGLFIGKGGETIKDLRERCGGQVSITIQPASTPGGMQGVRVVGDNWKLAKALVRAKIEELMMSKSFKQSGVSRPTAKLFTTHFPSTINILSWPSNTLPDVVSMGAEELWELPRIWRRRSLDGTGSFKRQRRLSPVTQEPVDPLTKLFRRSVSPSPQPVGPSVPSALLLARAAAAFGPKAKVAPSVDLTDLVNVPVKIEEFQHRSPEVPQKSPSVSPTPKSKAQERLSLTSWAVGGFTGGGPTEPRRVSGEGRLSLQMVSKLRLKKRNAVDLSTRKQSVDHTEEAKTEHSHFVPLCILERKPPEEVSWTPEVAPRRSRKSSAKPRPSAALGAAHRGLWLQSFRRYLYDGEIHADDLTKALLHSGIEDVRPQLIALVLAKVAEYNTLDEDEFLHFMCQYEEEQREDALNHFQKFAVNGQIPVESMSGLLAALELNPRFRVLTQICESREVNGDRAEPSTGLEFPQFLKVVEMLRQRFCFLQEELEHFRSVFQVFDRDNSGGMSLAELSSALAWLGFPISGSLCSLHQRHDLDSKGVLTEVEFLRCLRSLYEEEAQIINQYLNLLQNGRCRRGSELEQLLHTLGYTATVDILVDALQAHNLCKGYVRNSQLLGMSFAHVEFSLGLDELRELTCTIRTRDGFSDEEMEEMRKAFTMQSKSEAEISTPAIQKALRWLGHMYSFEMVQHLVTELDLDGDCMLDFTLFVKLIRKCRDRDRQEVANAFFALDPLDSGFLDHDQQMQALESLGLAEIMEIPLASGIRLQQFLKIVQHIKFDPVRVQQLRENDFFEEHELLELERHFRCFDKDGSGELQQQELVMLIEALFPRHANLREFRPYFSDLLAFADVNQNDCLDFKEFVRLIRKIRDHEEEFQFELYKETLEELGFSNKEAADLHMFFLEAGHRGTLTFEEVKDMIAGSFKLSEKESQKLLIVCRAPEVLKASSKFVDLLWRTAEMTSEKRRSTFCPFCTSCARFLTLVGPLKTRVSRCRGWRLDWQGLIP